MTDRPLSLGRDMDWGITEAVRGGATMVQLREKDCNTREFVQLAEKPKEVFSPFGLEGLANDTETV